MRRACSGRGAAIIATAGKGAGCPAAAPGVVVQSPRPLLRLAVRSERLANLDQPQSIVIESPAGNTTRLGRNKALYSPELPGFHELHEVGLENHSFPVAVNVHRIESNLAALTAKQFDEAIQRRKKEGSEVIPAPTLNGTQAKIYNGVWWFTLVLAVLLLLTETLLANRLTVHASLLNKRNKP